MLSNLRDKMSCQTPDSSDARGEIIFGLFGTGGFARETMPLVVQCITEVAKKSPNSVYRTYFVERDSERLSINGHPLISEKTFFEMECREKYFNIAIADSSLRERIARSCIRNNVRPLSIFSSNATIYEGNEIGAGALLCAHTIITSNIRIGKFFHSNIYSYVAHDCVIGDYVTFAPNVNCNGNVHIHDHAYIGTGAIIKQGSPSKPLIIGEHAIVGMGAVVTKDVSPFTTVVGNPARPVTKSSGS